MFEEMRYIELSGEKYPIKCDLLVLEKIQDEFGDVADFENRMTGFEPKMDEDGEPVKSKDGRLIGYYKTPNVKVLSKALVWMIEEGIAIQKERGEKAQELERDTLLRKVDVSPRELGEMLQKEFARCFERKNKETTQGETMEENQEIAE